MRTAVFAWRNVKEILRDKVNLFFGFLFPLMLLGLLSLIQANIPVDLFRINRLAPGIAVFGFSFLPLFSGSLIAKDRSSAFFSRLCVSPMTAADFVIGYTLPMLPIAVIQMTVCYVASFFLGLKPSMNLLLAAAVSLPAAVVFIGFGLLCGSLFTERQVGTVCGALLTNLCGWFSGIWFDPDLVGGFFRTAADLLPFSHAVNAAASAVSGDYAAIWKDLYWVLGYAAALLVLSLFVFRRRNRNL